MTILAFGTSLPEMQSEGLYSGANGGTVATANYIAPNVAEGISIGRDANPLHFGFDFTPTADLWFSFYFTSSNNIATGVPFFMVYGGGVELFRLQQAGGPILQYHNNTSWQSSGVVMRYAENFRTRFDCHFVVHDSTGTLTVYIDGQEQTQANFGPGDTLLRGESLMDEVRWDHPITAGSVQAYISACFVSTTDTRMLTYVQRAIDGAGAETDWTGAYTDIDEAGGDDADLIQASTNADKATYTFAALPASFNAGYSVPALGVSARASSGAASPANLQLAARHSTTNGFSANNLLSSVFGPHQATFVLNPSTSLAWTFAEADAAEVGVQAIT